MHGEGARTPGAAVTLIVDASNVVGTRPDGWWRDRPGAVRRLLMRLRCYAERTGLAVVLVLDVAVPDLLEAPDEGVAVLVARRRGRDAADDRIVELLRDGVPAARVVTSDRGLADRVVALGAEVVGAGRFLAELDRLGC